MRSPITIVGVAFILVGAVLLAGPSFGFGTFAAERPLSVTTADDASAYVSAVQTTSTVTLEYGDGPVTVGSFGNRLSAPLTVENLTVQGPDTGLVAIESPTAGETIPAGDTIAVSLRCSGDGDALDSPLTLMGTFSSPTTTVEGASFTKPVDIECQHPVVGIDGELVSAGNSGKVTFQIQTQGDLELTITDFSITTQNDLAGVSFTEQGSQFDGGPLPTTVNDPIEVRLDRFDSGISLDSTNFVDQETADIVVTLDLDEYGTVSVGIDASEFTGGPPGGGGPGP